MESFSYRPGKPAFNKILINAFGPLYCAFNIRKMRIKIKEIKGKVPLKGGILIASHHEDDADPFVIKKAIKRRLNWIAATRLSGKSILDRPFLKRIWDMFGIVSIHPTDYRRNKGIFDYLAYLLSIGEAIVIFPEGNLRSERKKRFGKAKDGCIRIVDYAYRKYKKAFPIIPIGIKYQQKDNKKYAYIRIGKQFFPDYKEKAEKEMRRLMIEIKKLSC